MTLESFLPFLFGIRLFARSHSNTHSEIHTHTQTSNSVYCMCACLNVCSCWLCLCFCYHSDSHSSILISLHSGNDARGHCSQLLGICSLFPGTIILSCL